MTVQFRPSVKKALFLLSFCLCLNSQAQDNLDSLMSAASGPEKPEPVMATFKTTKLVNLQTTEQVKRGELDFRITHRFDDIGGSAGGVKTLYGFDNVTDIRIAFDYGLNDRWAIGFGRSKGAYVRKQILDFNTKIKILQQKNDNSIPFNASLYMASEISTMESSSDTMSTAYYGASPWHRVNYVSQLLLSRKFGDRLSIELAPTLIHRNLVHYTETNTTFALGFGIRYKFTKRFGVICDYYYSFDKTKTPENGYYAALGVGIEIETGGHVFHLLFSNNKGVLESQYLTENKDSWLEGQVRFGFNISRVFHVGN